MAKKVWKAGTMLYPVPPVMVTCGTAQKSNVFTAAWTGIVNSEPAMTYISVRPERYSHELIRETGEFVINLTTADMVKAADFCGVKSGRTVDKFAETGLATEQASAVACPLLEAAPVCLECRVKEIKSLGSHDMFLAEIVAVDVDEDLVDETGALRLEKSRPAAFCHGKYYAIGAELGTFGFSVAKKKTRKRRIAEIKEKRKEERLRREAETEKDGVVEEKPKRSFKKPFGKSKFANGGKNRTGGRKHEDRNGFGKEDFERRPSFEKPFDKPFDKRRKEYGKKPAGAGAKSEKPFGRPAGKPVGRPSGKPERKPFKKAK